jgi:ubiquinone/menaquinone biosynthesis C-methylase UbiE
MEYEYSGLMAEAWDLLRGDTSAWEDRGFYLRAVRRYGESVLDVGCGTGRILLDFSAQGIDIDGLDNSPEMLSICRTKAAALGLIPNLFEQEVQRAELPRKYKTILIPSSSLQLIIEPSERDEALQRLRGYLEPGGVVISPFMALWQEGDPLESASERSAIRPSDGATIRRLTRTWYNPKTECERTEDTYQVVDGGVVVKEEVHRRNPAVRGYSQAQAKKVFFDAGFTAVTLTSGFTERPATTQEPIFVVTATAD